MPSFEFTSPDGKKYTVDGPEGSTKEQAFQILQKQISTKPPDKPLEKKNQDTYGSIMSGAANEFLKDPSIGGAASAILGAQSKGMHMLGKEAGEAALSAGGKLGLPPEATAALATAANVGISDVLPGLIGGGAGGLAKGAAKKGAEDLMSSALKMATNKAKGGGNATAIRTMLDEGINVTQGGLRKLRSKLDELNNEISGYISSSPASISKSKVASYMKEAIDKFKGGITPQSDLAALRKTFDEFMQNPFVPKQIPVAQAQKLKQTGYKALGEKPFEQINNPAGVAGQKSILKGLKEEIAGAVPEVGPLNARESKLLQVLDPLEKRVIVEARKNPGGLVWLAHNPAEAVAFLADRSSGAKSILSRMIDEAGKKAPTLGAGVGAAVGEVNQQKSLREATP